MNIDSERRYCQSCGMPLDLSMIERLGTNNDQSKSHEYCFYCLKDGEYIVDYTMDQMIDVWIKYTDKYNGYANSNYTSDELRKILTLRMPTLKRWQQRRRTEHFHFEIMNRIRVYINQHLFEQLDTEHLSERAGMSPFHFRRIFKNITGENTGSYIQRLRLEYIAYKLITTNLSLREILNKTPIYTKYSLSKAFKKHFTLSPSEYRRQLKGIQTDNKEEINVELNLQIKRIEPLPIIYLPVGNAYTNIKNYHKLWEQLILFAQDNKLRKDKKFISLSLDEPMITKAEQCRFYLGIATDGIVKPSGIFGEMEIPAGLYVVFRHTGSHTSLHNLYKDIYLNWLPNSGYRQREPLTFEMYMNTPREVPDSELITDIYIPIEKQNSYDGTSRNPDNQQTGE